MTVSPELVNVLDEGGDIVATVTREQAEAENYTTENVLVFAFNSLGKVWLHKRPKTKRHYPGLWDISACGGIMSGETPPEAAQREMEEELGFSTDLQYAESFLNIFPSEDGAVSRRRLSHLFIAITDQEPQRTQDADGYMAVPYGALAQQVAEDESAYVPSFLTEYRRALLAYEALP